MNPATSDGAVTLSAGTITATDWANDRTLQVEHDDWSEAAQITVTVGTGLTDVAGNPLAAEHAFSFWTESPGQLLLLETTPADGATDINRDGKPEILIARHDELARNMLKDFRSFSKARIESLGWDGLGLVPVWKTRTFSGRASDFTVGDFDNDGMDELVIAVVAKEGAIAFTSAKSSLIAFDLNPQ